MPFINEKWRANLLNSGLLLLRIIFCGVLITHGWTKMTHFSDMVQHFDNPIGLGRWWSVVLVIFAEVFCAFAVLVGAATRLALVPMIISMSVAFFIHHAADVFQKKELAFLYLAAFVVMILTGPGRFSIDALIMGGGGGGRR